MPERRWRRVQPEGAVEIVLAGHGTEIAKRIGRRLLGGATMRWQSLAGVAPAGADRIDAERTVHALIDAGLVEVAERRDKAGDFRPYMLRMAEGAEDRLGRLVGDDPRSAELRAERARRLIESLAAMAKQPDALPVPARALVQRALGNTKVVRVGDFRAEIEEAFDLPLDALVRDHTAAVLSTGPFRIRFQGRVIDGLASQPWTAIPEPVLAQATGIELDADEILTVENLTPFETMAFRGEAGGRILVFTSGFLGRAERRWLEMLIRTGQVRRIRHWGDIDPGGIAIFRDLAALVAAASQSVRVESWRMETSALSHAAAVPLTARDRSRLQAWIADPAAPLQELARAMLASDRKLEQEALLVDDPGW
jgi:hypothetical protein